MNGVLKMSFLAFSFSFFGGFRSLSLIFDDAVKIFIILSCTTRVVGYIVSLL